MPPSGPGQLRFPCPAGAPRANQAWAIPFVTTLPITSQRFLPVPAYGGNPIEIP